MLSSVVLRGALVGAFAAVAFGLTAAPADACSCSVTRSGQPACKYRWTSSAVFTARVVDIESVAIARSVAPADRQASSPRERRVRVAVREAFAGAVSGAEIDIFTGWGDADCGFAFEPGREYLIYTYTKSDGSLGTGLCSPTKKIEEASADLAYLRAVPATPPSEGRLIGLVSHADAPGVTDWRKMPPYPGGRVIAEGNRLVRSALAGADGAYEIFVPPGRYRLRPEVPAGMYASIVDRDVELTDARGCTVADVSVRYDGHVTGVVVTTSRQPVPALPVRLIKGTNSIEGRTDGDGRFDVGHVPIGAFMLSTPLSTDVPAVGLNVAASERIDLGRIVVPERIRFLPVQGRVVDADGRAAAGARIYLRPDFAGISGDLLGPAVVTDAEGRFALAAVEGQTYRLIAEQPTVPGPGFLRAEMRGVNATPGATPIVLTVRRPGN
jgi:hypothetical protein